MIQQILSYLTNSKNKYYNYSNAIAEHSAVMYSRFLNPLPSLPRKQILPLDLHFNESWWAFSKVKFKEVTCPSGTCRSGNETAGNQYIPWDTDRVTNARGLVPSGVGRARPSVQIPAVFLMLLGVNLTLTTPSGGVFVSGFLWKSKGFVWCSNERSGRIIGLDFVRVGDGSCFL